MANDLKLINNEVTTFVQVLDLITMSAKLLPQHCKVYSGAVKCVLKRNRSKVAEY